jgi:hypothetical protein
MAALSKKSRQSVETICHKRKSPLRVPKTPSVFHPRAQRNAFPRRDARLQSGSFACRNPRLTEIARVHGCFSSQSFWKAGSERKGSQSGSSLKSAGVTPELTCERCASTASQVDRLVGHRNFNAQFLSKRSTIDWACFLREAKNF